MPTSGYTFTPTASLSINPVTTTITLPGGVTQVRTLTLPPWPAIMLGPSGSWNFPNSSEDPFQNLPTPPPAPPVKTLPSMVKPEWTPPATTSPPTATWPEFAIVPVKTVVPEGGEDDDGDGPKSKSTCKLWFFWVSLHSYRSLVKF
jgi:chitinase